MWLSLSVAGSLWRMVQGYNLTAFLEIDPHLSSALKYLRRNPASLDLYSNAHNVTLFVGDNSAYDALAFSGLDRMLQIDSINRAALRFQLLKGTYDRSNFSTIPVFLPTYLNDTDYHVSGGEMLELKVYAHMNGTLIIGGGLGSSAFTCEEPLRKDDNVFVYIVHPVLFPPLNFSLTGDFLNSTSMKGMASESDLTKDLFDITYLIPEDNAYEELLGNVTKAELENIFAYHLFLNGTRAYSTDLVDCVRFPTFLPGYDITATTIDGVIYVNDVIVRHYMIEEDLLLQNGVGHFIEGFVDYRKNGGKVGPCYDKNFFKTNQTVAATS